MVSLVGDGSFLFSVPSSALWAQPQVRYPGAHGPLRQPRLGGAQVLDADGASRGSGGSRQRLPRVVGAVGRPAGSGAVAGVSTVSDPGELPQMLKDALAVVHGGRSAVVSVQLPSV